MKRHEAGSNPEVCQHLSTDGMCTLAFPGPLGCSGWSREHSSCPHTAAGVAQGLLLHPSLQLLLRGVCLPITPDQQCNDTSEGCGSPTGVLWESKHLQALGGSCRAPHNPIWTWLPSAVLWALSLCCTPGPRLCISAGSLHHSLQSRHSSRAAAALIFPGKVSTGSSNSRCFITPIALGKYDV